MVEDPPTPVGQGAGEPESEAAPKGRRLGRGLRDIAHLFMSPLETERLPPARPAADCVVAPDWHRRQLAKITSVARLLRRLDDFLSPHVEAILEHAPHALQAIAPGVPGREHLVPVRHAAEEIQGVWNALRDMQRQPRPDASAVELHTIIRRVLRFFPAVESGARIHLDLRLGSSQPRVPGPAHLIETAVFHLVRNAVEAMNHAGGTLTLEVPDAGPQIVLRVRDTGPGIPPDLLEHVAEPLVTTRGAQGHVGMGLTLAISIIDSLGGSLALESQVGKGTTATVTLPRFKEQ